MTNNQIKKAVEKQFSIIADANKKLDEIRSNCRHEKTRVGLWQFGASWDIVNAEICEYCQNYVRTAPISYTLTPIYITGNAIDNTTLCHVNGIQS